MGGLKRPPPGSALAARFWTLARARRGLRAAPPKPRTKQGHSVVLPSAEPGAGRRDTEPFLFTEHLVLRPLEVEDAWGMREILADPEPRRRGGEARAPTLEDARGRLARLVEHGRRNGLGLWAVCEKRTGGILGVCGLFPFEGRGPEVELAYQLRLPSWCKDHAAEVVGECLRYGLEELSLERIVAVMDPDDPISARALGVTEKAGMGYRETRRIHGRELFVYASTERAAR